MQSVVSRAGELLSALVGFFYVPAVVAIPASWNRLAAALPFLSGDDWRRGSGGGRGSEGQGQRRRQLGKGDCDGLELQGGEYFATYLALQNPMKGRERPCRSVIVRAGRCRAPHAEQHWHQQLQCTLMGGQRRGKAASACSQSQEGGEGRLRPSKRTGA